MQELSGAWQFPGMPECILVGFVGVLMSRFSQIVFSILFSLTSVATNLNSHCVAQEKLRIDTETVAVQKSPWEEIQVSTKSSLHGLHVVNKDIIWASGDDGTTLLSTDGGVSWRERKVEDPTYPDGPLLVLSLIHI